MKRINKNSKTAYYSERHEKNYYFSQCVWWRWDSFKFGFDWSFSRGFADVDVYFGFLTWGFIYIKNKENQ